MIRMPSYDIDPPAEAIHTETIAKPEPESDPLDIWESHRTLETPDSSSEKSDAVLFSGGDDSLALTHMAMENGWTDLVIHLDTNSSIPENLDYVRAVSEEYNWPLMIISSPMPLDTFAYRYGFPGPSAHTMAFNYFKSRQLGFFYRKKAGEVRYFSGVRKLESDRRMKNVKAEVQYASTNADEDFSGWWVSPLIDKSDEWVEQYRDTHDLPHNPVTTKIHRSGDCQCLAYGNREEELVMIEAEYPEFAEWLHNVETRTQEYRGRVQILAEQYPTVSDHVNELRKEERPNPMRLSVLKDHYPGVFDAIASVDKDTAILKGKTDPTAYIGHGGLSSKELRNLVTHADTSQQTLCENCGDPCYTRASSVEAHVEDAEERAQRAETVQQTLPAEEVARKSSPVISNDTPTPTDSTIQTGVSEFES